jgi:DNA (cytosine-5)-methyltransferase 3A
MKFRNKKTGEIRDCTPNMLNASLVSAQNRKRLFWVGELVNDLYKVLCIYPPEDKRILLKDIIEGDFNGLWSDYNNSISFDKSKTLGAACGISRSTTCQQVIKFPVKITKIGKGGQRDKIYLIEDKSTTLLTKGKKFNDKTVELDVKNKESYSHGVNGLVAIKDYVRKLFPSECEKLQCLPVGYTEFGLNDKNIQKISDTQRYKTLGNAFNVDIIVHIFNCIKERL